MPNQDIHELIKSHGLRKWKVADFAKIADTTFSRWLRHEMPADKKQLIMRAIAELVADKEVQSRG